MGDLINFKEKRYENHFKAFYKRMLPRGIKDLIAYSYHQNDFRSNNDPFEKARLRALLNQGIEQAVNLEDKDYLMLLTGLKKRIT